MNQSELSNLLDNAVDNGYNCRFWSSQKIAEDLLLYSSCCEDEDSENLIPLIDEWKRC